VGLADWYVPSDRLPSLIASLASVAPAEALAAVASEAPASGLLADREWIDSAYEGDDVVKILARLAGSEVEAARETSDVLAAKSPTSVKVTLRALRSAADLPTLRAALDQEYRLSLRFHGSHDFLEGVRAQVIDKDRNPQWVPSSLDEVAEETVAAYFAGLGADELGLTQEGAL
jgi:enoyl-CoA hydratase